LVEAFHVPKLLSQQLLRLGDPVMDWECWLSGSSSFSSVRASRTVREGLADGPRAQCLSCVLRVLARLRL
jgi:hypothetical protein